MTVIGSRKKDSRKLTVLNSTSCKSFVRRLMISPLRWSLKYPIGRLNIFLNISERMSFRIRFRIGFRTYMARYRKTFFRKTADTTTRQIIAKAFVFPSDDTALELTSELKYPDIFPKKPEADEPFFKASVWSKISKRKGLSNPSDTNEKMVDNTLKEKYAKTSLGYLLMYLKMTRRLFIEILAIGSNRRKTN